MTLNLFSGRVLRSTWQGLAVVALVGLLSACGGGRGASSAQLDLGAAASRPGGNSSLPANIPIAVPAATSAALLSETMVVWRVGDLGQPQAYSTYQWIAPPARLVTQRLIDRLSLQGAVLSQNVGGDLPQLRTNLQRFEQTFSPDGSSSRAQLTMQVVLLKGSKVVNQLLVDVSVPAKSQDAMGGAQALREATDQTVEQVAQWLTSELKRNN
jgi:ABC-type uncharacterized transport system auxiliary subunit